MGKPLIPAQRREKIQEYLGIHQIARTADLMDLLEASEATVRRDLEWLEQKGSVRAGKSDQVRGTKYGRRPSTTQ